MTEAHAEVQLIPLSSISVLNPRARNETIFNEMVTSIARLGLKRPITIARREEGKTYDLVCGQGRLEAYRVLGRETIPAIVIDVSRTDCYVMSLVENLARRNHTSLEFIREIGFLKDRGYSAVQVAEKIDFSREHVSSIFYLLEHSEDRLMTAIEKGQMPHTVAVEIARSKNCDLQKILTDGYQAGTITGKQVTAIRRIVGQRGRAGKSVYRGYVQSNTRTANALTRQHRQETERQALVIKKAKIARSRLLFVVTALQRLLSDEHFTTLLRAEGIHTIPKSLAARIYGKAD
ncbi:MAG: ParB/RepB/Spo0J family partition protein [Xanthobacteraceae bacterium]|nr:ParB/RepB/Spo0J family partition protein [Xanthobacteraceae bacterium]